MAWEDLFKVERANVAKWLEMCSAFSPTLLYGPPGTGKTTDVFVMAKKLGLEVAVMHCDGAAVAAQYIGQHTPGTSGVWKYHAGAILDAWGHGVSGKPKVLCIDDLHLLGPDGMAAIYVACDGFYGASHTLEDVCPCGCGQQTVTPKEGYRVVATMNGIPRMLDEPVLSRMRYIMPVMVPSPDQLAALQEDLADLCEFDYERGSEQIAEYREYKAISDLWSAGQPLRAALGLALNDAEKCRKIAMALHGNGNAEATKLVGAITKAAPSGAPGSGAPPSVKV